MTNAADDFSAIAAAMKGTKGQESCSDAGPDALLIGLCGEAVRLEHVIYVPGLKTIEEEQEHDAKVEPIKAKQAEILEKICSLPTLSIEGFRARAKAATILMPSLVDHVRGDCHGMIAALLEGLTEEDRP